MKRTSLFLDDKLLKALKRTAVREGVSVASIVREAVSRYLAEPESTGTLPAIAGRFGSGKRGTANDTDKYLWPDPHA